MMEDMGPHIARNHPGMQVVKLMTRKYDINNYEVKELSNKAKMASSVELLKQPIQCHKCLDMVQGGPDGMLDHIYQVHNAISSYPKDYNTR